MPRKQLFLAHFTFRCGEAEVPFHHTLFAETMEDAVAAVDKYLSDFGAGPERLGAYSYAYEKGDYAVLFEELGSETSDRVVKHLLISGTGA